MTFKEQYDNRKPLFLNDKAICKENRDLFKQFFEWEENKLKRKNNLMVLDENCYKTLYEYIVRLKTVNDWFNNKAWTKLTEKEIEKVYNDLEDGKIKSTLGKPYEERKNFYNKIFKSKPFELAGKKEISKKVIQFYAPRLNTDVRYIEEDAFVKLQRNAIKDNHKLLMWLAWDIGENVNSLLQLKKEHFRRQDVKETGEPEYLVFLPKEILKRARTPRSEPTLYMETVRLIDECILGKKNGEYLFDFDYRNALKIFDRAVRISKITCKPKAEKPSWKDLRSGMACHLLKKGWTTDEVNARLGHKPSSQELDKYINFLALDRHTPKKKLNDGQLQKLIQEIEEMKEKEKLNSIRIKDIKDQAKKDRDDFKLELKKMAEDLKQISR